MKGPVKPCEGRFNDELQAVLNRNTDRAQWASHTCEVCGLAVGATVDRGRWIPEQHWPSVKYQSSKNADKIKEIPANAASPEDAPSSSDLHA